MWKITFKYHGDVIQFRPKLLWRRLLGRSRESCFYSTVYGEYFNYFSDYWQMVGKKSALLQVIQRGSSHIQIEDFTEEEVYGRFAQIQYPGQPVVVLYDIDKLNAARTLNNLATFKVSTMLSDVVAIACKTREEACKIADSIPLSLARANAYDHGMYLKSNLLNVEKGEDTEYA